ncbi:MAG: DNA-3-methyladenine glycosylase [Cyclobacteriaceae bacterium]
MNTSDYVKIPKSFYEREDVVKIARELLGKYLFTRVDGVLTGGKIVETEAYNGRTDKASHAYKKRTNRTEVMYQNGGIAYVYLCYGIHHMFNIVTNRSGLADAVLVRAVEPTFGIDRMVDRYGSVRTKVSNGPGKLSKALGINTDLNGTDLSGDKLFIATHINEKIPKIAVDTRIGVDYAEEDALLPWRFYIEKNEWVSKQRTPVN